MNQSGVLVQLVGLCFGYREGHQNRAVLTGLDGEIRRGECLALLGQSGSGKSTLLNLIAGLDVPDAGDIVIDGLAINRMREKQRSLFRRRFIGFIFQFFNLLPTLTVAENVLLPLELAGTGSKDRHDALRLLKEVGLAGRDHRYPDQLSGGEQQRVAIVRSLAQDPALILADEPTGNLDSETGEQVLALFDQLIRERGKTLLIATHNQEVARHADRIIHLRDGRFGASGT